MHIQLKDEKEKLCVCVCVASLTTSRKNKILFFKKKVRVYGKQIFINKER